MPLFSVIAFVFVLWLWKHKSSGYYELVEESGCHDTEFRLICGKLDAKIAIFEATFSRNVTVFSPLKASCENKPPRKRLRFNHEGDQVNSNLVMDPTSKALPVKINFRHAINKRCSGVNYCSFILTEDHPPAILWGSGTTYLRYVCLDEVDIIKSCIGVLNITFEGFIRSPGYPQYYTGERNCHWKLEAQPSQTIKINFLDISLRGIGPFEKDCLDRVVVSEDGFEMLTACGDSTGDIQIQSVGSSLNVSLTTTSPLLYPKRGILFHYKAVGCSTPRTPGNGYLIFRSKSQVRYRCRSGYIFPDTLSRDRKLHCYNEYQWDNDVPDCSRASVSVSVVDSPGNLTSSIHSDVNFMAKKLTTLNKGDDEKDIIIPSVLIAAILTGNGFLLILICYYRKNVLVLHVSEHWKTPVFQEN